MSDRNWKVMLKCESRSKRVEDEMEDLVIGAAGLRHAIRIDESTISEGTTNAIGLHVSEVDMQVVDAQLEPENAQDAYLDMEFLEDDDDDDLPYPEAVVEEVEEDDAIMAM